MNLKIIFMGTAELACASLTALLQSQEFKVVAVVTQPDRPKGRALKLQPSPVKELALRAGLPVLQPARARDPAFLEQLRPFGPDFIVVAAYGQLLPAALLTLPPLGCVNVHASLLPKYRGAGPIQWAILNDEAETGVTIMRIAPTLDTGDILSQRATTIIPQDTAVTLHDRLAQMGAQLLVATLPECAAGVITARPQVEAEATYAPKITKQDGRLDWSQPARSLWNRVRAFNPWPGAFTFPPAELKLGMVKIRRASLPEAGIVAADVSRRTSPLPASGEADRRDSSLQEIQPQTTPPGVILHAGKQGIVVACGQGALRVEELQLEGGRAMTAAEFLAGHPLPPGVSLG